MVAGVEVSTTIPNRSNKNVTQSITRKSVTTVSNKITRGKKLFNEQ